MERLNMFKATFSASPNFNADFNNQNHSIDVEFTNTISGGGSGLPAGGQPGDILTKKGTYDGVAEWITPADSAEQDNTRPITAAAVYTEIGNINALLATI